MRRRMRASGLELAPNERLPEDHLGAALTLGYQLLKRDVEAYEGGRSGEENSANRFDAYAAERLQWIREAETVGGKIFLTAPPRFCFALHGSRWSRCGPDGETVFTQNLLMRMLHRTTDLQTTSSSTCARVVPSGRAAFVRNRAGKRRAALCEALFAFVMLLFLSAPGARRGTRVPVRVGILETVGRLTSAETFLPTINYLRKELALEGAELVVTYHDIESMRAALSNRELDFFISNPGSSRLRSRPRCTALATQRPREAMIPMRRWAASFCPRGTRDLRLEDLKGKRAVAVAPNGFGGYYVGLGEIEEAVRDRGLNKWKPESFFGGSALHGLPHAVGSCRAAAQSSR